MAAGQLGWEFHPTGEFKNKSREATVNRSFGKAIDEWNRHKHAEAAALFEKHVKGHPNSP